MMENLIMKIEKFFLLFFFIMKEIYKGRRRFWKTLCTQYAVLWYKLIKNFSRTTEFFIHFIYRILNLFIKSKFQKYNPGHKIYDRELRAFILGGIIFSVWSYLSKMLIIGLNLSNFGLGIRFLIIFAPFVLYVLFSFFCFLITAFVREIKKIDEMIVYKYDKVLFHIVFTIVFFISFMLSLATLLLVDYSRNMIIYLSFCLHSSVVNVFGLVVFVKVIEEVFYKDKLLIDQISGKEVVLVSFILFLLNIPLIYRFQSLLERMDSRWKKVDLTQSILLMQCFWFITFISMLVLFSIDNTNISQFEVVAIIVVFCFYLFFIIIHSYKIVSQKSIN